jgi:periplasmic divalent cation tolerance protein
MSEELVVLVTVGSREAAEAMAETLVGERLAACVNVVGPVRSIYRWHGEVCRDDEHLMIVKTTRSRYAELERRIGELHTYEVPEVIALPIERGAASYLAWLRAETEPGETNG